MTAANPLPPSAARVQEALAALGLSYRVLVLERSARTSAEAAVAVGCTVAQIAKSLVFRRAGGGAPVLVIASGAGRVDEALVSSALGTPIEKADADYVRTVTGFAIGGIAPIGHSTPIETLIDRDLLAHTELWAAAGHPNALFKLAPDDLVKMTSGRVVSVR